MSAWDPGTLWTFLAQCFEDESVVTDEIQLPLSEQSGKSYISMSEDQVCATFQKCWSLELKYKGVGRR